MGYRVTNNRKNTPGRQYKFVNAGEVYAFVVKPRHGTKTAEANPDFRHVEEVPSVSPEQIKSLTGFINASTKGAREKAIRKFKKEKALENVNSAYARANKIVKDFPDGEMIILPKVQRSFTKIKLPK